MENIDSIALKDLFYFDILEYEYDFYHIALASKDGKSIGIYWIIDPDCGNNILGNYICEKDELISWMSKHKYLKNILGTLIQNKCNDNYFKNLILSTILGEKYDSIMYSNDLFGLLALYPYIENNNLKPLKDSFLAFEEYLKNIKEQYRIYTGHDPDSSRAVITGSNGWPVLWSYMNMQYIYSQDKKYNEYKWKYEYAQYICNDNKKKDLFIYIYKCLKMAYPERIKESAYQPFK